MSEIDETIIDELEVTVKDSGGTVIDPATTGDVQAVRDRLPDTLDGDGGLKVHVQNQSASTIQGTVDDISPTSTPEGDAGPVRMTPTGDLHVNLRAQDGTEVVPATETTLADISLRLPTTLDGDGGLKVHVQNTSSAATDINITGSDIQVPTDLQSVYWRIHDTYTTPLEAGATHTSTSEDITNYTKIMSKVYTDQASTLYVEQSEDDVNWDLSVTFTVLSSTVKSVCVERKLKYGRVRLVNGATPQTTLRFNTNLSVL